MTTSSNLIEQLTDTVRVSADPYAQRIALRNRAQAQSVELAPVAANLEVFKHEFVARTSTLRGPPPRLVVVRGGAT